MQVISNQEIKNIILSHNQNPDIKWKVVKNTKKEILLTNDYDSNILFKISVVTNVEGRGDIDITDEFGWNRNVGYLIYGTDFWCDFNDYEKGFKKAVGMVVKFFYYYY